MFSKAKKVTAIQARRLFLAAALFLTAFLVVWIVVQSSGSIRSAPSGVKPDFAALLPAAIGSSGPILELFDVPVSSYVATYAGKDGAHAALIVWDKLDYGYRLADDLALAGTSDPLSSVSRLTSEILGGGAPALIVAEGPDVGAHADEVVLIERQGGDLRAVTLVDADGKSRNAQFFRGASAKYSSDLAFEDVNGDGGKEVVARSGETGDDGKETVVDSVYAWRDGAFRYDADLSWALSTSARVFPSP